MVVELSAVPEVTVLPLKREKKGETREGRRSDRGKGRRREESENSLSEGGESDLGPSGRSRVLVNTVDVFQEGGSDDPSDGRSGSEVVLDGEESRSARSRGRTKR